jgi:hypothetical protein
MCLPMHAMQVEGRLRKEWGKLESAREGSLRNRAFRMVQSVLSREDPKEIFLKSIPQDTPELEVIYPVSVRCM